MEGMFSSTGETKILYWNSSLKEQNQRTWERRSHGLHHDFKHDSVPKFREMSYFFFPALYRLRCLLPHLICIGLFLVGCTPTTWAPSAVPRTSPACSHSGESGRCCGCARVNFQDEGDPSPLLRGWLLRLTADPGEPSSAQHEGNCLTQSYTPSLGAAYPQWWARRGKKGLDLLQGHPGFRTPEGSLMPLS